MSQTDEAGVLGRRTRDYTLLLVSIACLLFLVLITQVYFVTITFQKNRIEATRAATYSERVKAA
jgi:hypothetical protein